MRTYDFAPLWRSSVGFDRLFDLINDTQRLDAQDNYPPYDIVRTGENAYRICVALAGFSPDEISITAQQNRLTVAGSKAEHKAGPMPEHEYLHQAFRRAHSSDNSTSKIMLRSRERRLRTACSRLSSRGRSPRR
jgi:HSP20 family molecular chaperone IbpA